MRSPMHIVWVAAMTVAAAACYYVKPDINKREYRIQRQRIQWDSEGEVISDPRLFEVTYRMPIASFRRLLKLVRPYLHEPDSVKSRNRTGTDPASVGTKLAVTLRFLAGASYCDIAGRFRLSVPHVYSIVHEGIDAILSVPSLQIRFPSTDDEREAEARGFASMSTQQCIRHCIGCIDGFLVPTRVPTSREVGRVEAFYSGHYSRYGVSLQACCGWDARVTAFACNCGGSTNDCVAYDAWGVQAELENVTGLYYVIGDAGYTQSRWAMTPFKKPQLRNRKDRDNYNYYLSQLRITIERCFGILAHKWRLLRTGIEVGMASVPKVVEACIRLHNFCIEERKKRGGFSVRAYMRELYAVDGSDFDYNVVVPDVYLDPSDSPMYSEMLRNVLVRHISNLNLQRPPLRTCASRTAG
eukprot:GHVU01120812.1.p1 GENE.GHVU01120812.1~~GHVU01120812.1.p1  ORF type:complete len:412 (-),score=28.66 GHVU01120812.1:401-1636(-)